MRAVKYSCRRSQPRGVSGVPPWRAARRSMGSLMVLGVRGGEFRALGSLAGRAVEVRRIHVHVFRVG